MDDAFAASARGEEYIWKEREIGERRDSLCQRECMLALALSAFLIVFFSYALRREVGGRYGNVRSHALATAGSIRLRKKINPVASGNWEMSGGAVVAASPPLASTPWQQDPPAIRLATETVPARRSRRMTGPPRESRFFSQETFVVGISRPSNSMEAEIRGQGPEERLGAATAQRGRRREVGEQQEVAQCSTGSRTAVDGQRRSVVLCAYVDCSRQVDSSGVHAYEGAGRGAA